MNMTNQVRHFKYKYNRDLILLRVRFQYSNAANSWYQLRSQSHLSDFLRTKQPQPVRRLEGRFYTFLNLILKVK